MSAKRFTPEFKQETVRQIVERGPSVSEVSARIGVSAHSLYPWVKAVTPEKTEQQTNERLFANNVANRRHRTHIVPGALTGHAGASLGAPRQMSAPVQREL